MRRSSTGAPNVPPGPLPDDEDVEVVAGLEPDRPVVAGRRYCGGLYKAVFVAMVVATVIVVADPFSLGPHLADGGLERLLVPSARESDGTAAPEQVHISLGRNETEIIVMWYTTSTRAQRTHDHCLR